MHRVLTGRILFLAMTLITAVVVAAADRVQPGQWETTLTGAAARPLVTRYCITPAEAKSMSGDLAMLRKYLEDSTAAKTKGRCVVKNVTLDGNRTTVTIVCGKSEVIGTTTYHGDHYESSSSDGTTVVGKRLGGCPVK